MRIRNKIWCIVATAGVALLQTGCVCDEPGAGCPVKAGDKYMALRIHVNSNETRAEVPNTPDGFGYESGNSKETEIKNIHLFFVKRTGSAHVTMDDSGTPIIGHAKATATDDSQVQPSIFEIKVQLNFDIDDIYKAELFVIANLNDEDKGVENVKTVGQLRDYVLKQTFKYNSNPKLCESFTMTNSEKTASYFLESDNKGRIGNKKSPFISKAYVSRLAARVDLMYSGSVNNPTGANYNKSLSYNVRELMQNYQGDMVYTPADARILSVVPVNINQTGTYVAKRVGRHRSTDTGFNYADGTNGYCVSEFNTADDNYVVEPTTLLKLNGNTDYDAWFGYTAVSNYKAYNYAAYISRSLSLDRLLPGSFSSSQSGFVQDRSVTLFYANENTQVKENETSDNITGLLFKCEYTPKKLYSNMSDNGTMQEAGTFTAGSTFWRVDGDGQVVYFSNRAAANKYSTYRTGQGQNVTVTEYNKGLCYYYVGLRHWMPSIGTRPDPEIESNPRMEYAIVRNNIYRIGVNITGCGHARPTFGDPNNIQVSMMCYPWRSFTANEIKW